ncbi:MAG: acc operon protein [Halobacteriales archaeon]
MPDARALELPADATPDQAAAIIAALEQWLAAEARSSADDQPESPGWDGRRFAFAGRVEKLTGEAARVPTGAPSDPWTAMDRVRRD